MRCIADFINNAKWISLFEIVFVVGVKSTKSISIYVDFFNTEATEVYRVSQSFKKKYNQSSIINVR